VLFLDLACAGRVDLRCYRLQPPAIVILSASNQDSVRDLRQAGLSAWMKPEVFSRLPEILRWAMSAQTQPDCLCEQWAITLLQLGYRSAKDSPQVLAFNGEGQILIDGSEVLAASNTGQMTRIVLADRIVNSPHRLDFLAKQLYGSGLVRVGNRLLITRAHPWRILAASVKLSLRKLFQPQPRGASPVLR
jgi:DNA-binding LytR/AlgR family response regulator